MKRPETMIREYELENPPQSKSARLYTYIRPLKNREATIEIHAAVNAKRKGEPLMTKCVFRMRTDKSRYERRDILWYENWSVAAPPPHWVVDFHESGRGQPYMAKSGRADEHRVWSADYCSECERARFDMPRATMLNGFDGTKYKYCGFAQSCGPTLVEYLHLWNISPNVELLSKAGLHGLLNEDAVVAFADNPAFSKWLARNAARARDERWDFRKCCKLYGSELDLERVKKLEEEREAKRREAVRRADRMRIESRIRQTEKYSEAIRALYEKIKWICGTYKTFEVRVPQNNVDMVNEGEVMHNCIGCVHPPLVADGSEVVVFLCRDGKPYLDVAISTDDFKVIEVRRVCNEDADASEKKIADEIAKKVSRALRKAA